MQQYVEQLDKEHTNTKERLPAVAGKDLKEVEKVADEAGMKLTQRRPSWKVADLSTELDTIMQSLARSNQEMMVKEKAIESLKVELGKAKDLDSRLVEKDATVERLKEELSSARSSEAQALELLSKSQRRIQELELQVEREKESETKIMDSFVAQTKQLEQTKILLEESKLKISSPRCKVRSLECSFEQEGDGDGDGDGHELQEQLERLKLGLLLERQELNKVQASEKDLVLKAKQLSEEIESLKNELKDATEAEENSKKAMDDLALALKEVATESKKSNEKLILAQEELEQLKRELKELKEKLRSTEGKHEIVLEEARKEVDLYRNTAERLRLEAEESLLAWNGKERTFVECIRRAEEEKVAALEENNKLLESLLAAENMNKTAEQENQKLRNNTKEALNEANVAKEAAGIAQAENSQLKDILAEKDDALIFITRENESLRINEAAALENIKELKRLLSEPSGKELKAEEKDNDQKQKSASSTSEKEHGKKPSNAWSLNLKDLIIHNKHKDVEEEQKITEKPKDEDVDEDSDNVDPLKGSIFDVGAESPVAATAIHHRRRSSCLFIDDGEAVNSEDYEHLDGPHVDDLDKETSSRKKKALLRRFGDIITRRRSSIHRREPSIGGEVHKKEASESNKKETSEGHKKEHLGCNGGAGGGGGGGGEGPKKEPLASEGHKMEVPVGE